MPQAPSERAPVRRGPEVELASPPGTRGRLGFILIAADLASESELRAIGPLEDTAIFCTRVAYHSPLTVTHLRAMAGELAPAARQILPDDRLDVIAFGCTSGTMAIGEQNVLGLIRSARPGIKATTPLTAVRAASEALGVRRMAMLAPYTVDITTVMVEGFRATGLEFVDAMALGFHDDPQFSAIPGPALVAAARQADHPEAQALFIPCTALLTVRWIDVMERQLGKPVICSNQALLWHALRLAGNPDTVPGFGALFQVAPRPC